MKQEKEAWLEHLKQRVNEYEKPLPENDWNDFQGKLFTPYLHKRRRMTMMRIAAILLLLLIPVAITFFFSQTEEYMVDTSVLSLPLHGSEKSTSKPSPMPENNLSPAKVKSKTASLGKLERFTGLSPQQDSTAVQTIHEQAKATATAGIKDSTKTEHKPSVPQTGRKSGTLPKKSSGRTDFILPRKRSEYALALAVSAGNNGASTGFINRTFSRGDITNIAKNEIMYWKDYKNYLQEWPSDFPDTQAYAALLQIADDNMGRPMLEHTHYNLPVSFALSFRKSISRHWGVSAGLQYTYLSSESSVGESSEWIRRQKFHYIGLSVRLDRQLYTNRAFTLYAAGGGNIDKSVSGKLEQDFIVQKERVHSATEDLKIKPFQFSIHTTLGLQYNISPAIGAFAEPGAAYYFKDGSLKNTIRDKHPFSFNLQLGLRWNY